MHILRFQQNFSYLRTFRCSTRTIYSAAAVEPLLQREHANSCSRPAELEQVVAIFASAEACLHFRRDLAEEAHRRAALYSLLSYV